MIYDAVVRPINPEVQAKVLEMLNKTLAKAGAMSKKLDRSPGSKICTNLKHRLY